MSSSAHSSSCSKSKSFSFIKFVDKSNVLRLCLCPWDVWFLALGSFLSRAIFIELLGWRWYTCCWDSLSSIARKFYTTSFWSAAGFGAFYSSKDGVSPFVAGCGWNLEICSAGTSVFYYISFCVSSLFLFGGFSSRIASRLSEALSKMDGDYLDSTSSMATLVPDLRGSMI